MPSRRTALLLLLAAAGAPRTVAGQETPSSAAGGVSGVVVDAESSRPLPGALVSLEPQAIAAFPDAVGGSFLGGSRGTLTDSVGFYRFGDLAPGRYRLRISRAGYESATVAVEFEGSTASEVSVGLTVAPISLAPVEVRAVPRDAYGRGAAVEEEVAGSRVSAARARQRAHLASDARELTHADVVESVTLGETDLFRALHRAPGVGARDDYGAELWVRGASWDQTRVYFDGMPLYNPVHAFGLLAAVNTDAVGGAFLHPGIRSASFGDGAAAVLDVHSRAGGGSGGETRGMADLSLASGRLAADGRSRRGTVGWMVAGRRSWLDLFAAAASRITDDPQLRLPYAFSDLAGRVDVALGPGQSLEVSALRETDRITGTIPDIFHRTHAEWGNSVGRATVVTPFGKLRSRTTVGVSTYGAEVRRLGVDSVGEAGFSAATFRPSDTRLVHATLSTELAPVPLGSPVPWRVGGGIVYERGVYEGAEGYTHGDMGMVDADSALELRARAPRAVLWGERRWQGAQGLSLEAGLRLEAGAGVANAGVLRPAPRLIARYAPHGDLSFSAGVGRFFQHAQVLSGTGPVLGPGYTASHIWVVADEDVPVIRTDVASLGAELWAGDSWLFGATGYVRSGTGIVVPDPTPGLLEDRPLFRSAGNDAHGIELSARRLAGRWTASAAYTWGESTIEAANLRFPAREDRRHVLDLTTMVRVGSSLRLGGAFTYASGSPFTRVHGRTGDCSSGICEVEVIAEAPNAQRAPDYSSLDLLLDWTTRFRDSELGLYLQLRNALGHDNDVTFTDTSLQCSGTWTAEMGCEGTWSFHDNFQLGLPTLPLIGLRARF